jgi:hypothetical protein
MCDLKPVGSLLHGVNLRCRFRSRRVRGDKLGIGRRTFGNERVASLNGRCVVIVRRV